MVKKVKKAIFGGALALQAVPILRPEGRTTAALTRTAEGFVGIGVADAVADVAFGMVKPRRGLARKRKPKRRR